MKLLATYAQMLILSGMGRLETQMAPGVALAAMEGTTAVGAGGNNFRSDSPRGANANSHRVRRMLNGDTSDFVGGGGNIDNGTAPKPALNFLDPEGGSDTGRDPPLDAPDDRRPEDLLGGDNGAGGNSGSKQGAGGPPSDLDLDIDWSPAQDANIYDDLAFSAERDMLNEKNGVTTTSSKYDSGRVEQEDALDAAFMMPAREDQVMSELLSPGEQLGSPARPGRAEVFASSSVLHPSPSHGHGDGLPNGDSHGSGGNSGGRPTTASPGNSEGNPVGPQDTDAVPRGRPRSTGMMDDDVRRSRALAQATGSFGTFAPLECNPTEGFAEDRSDCDSTTLVSALDLAAEPLVIPCGSCYTFDLGESVILPGGLDVQGKLLFPTGYKTTVSTPYVLIQGELEITSTSPIAPDNESVRFILTGTDDTRTFSPAGAPNDAVCPNNGCELSRKAFVVAGGKLNIRGLPDDQCPTWTKLKGMAKGGMQQLVPEDLEGYMPPPTDAGPSCSAGLAALSFDFDDSNRAGWTGGDGSTSFVDDDGASASPHLVVSDRKKTWQGPRYDYTHMAPCLLPNTDYLVTIRLRLDFANGTKVGEETTCQKNYQSCVVLISKIGKANDHGIHKWKAGQRKGAAGKYGEFIHLTGKMSWNEEELDATNVYWVFTMEGPEAGINVIMDSFEIALPDETSYMDSAEPCGELAPNGNAEANGLNPYPMFTNHHESNLLVQVDESDGNHFYRLVTRKSHWASMAFNVNQKCFAQGLVYRASQSVRIHSETPVTYYVELVGNRQDGGWFSKFIRRCPAQSINDGNDGWVSCSADFIGDNELREAKNLRWQLVVDNNQAGNLADVDYDDVFVSFLDGPVEGLLVDSSIVSCWGAGSDIHVTSSTFSNRDGQVGVVESVIDRGDGTATLKLTDALNSVISEEDDPEFAVEIALLSRNVKIEGASDDGGPDTSGGYLQVLHTEGVAQIVDGVEFSNMGQQAVKNRYPIQFLYSGDVNGTVVSRNAIRESNQRCVVIEGSSNAVIAGNVAHNTAGHCFMVGFESENNLFERNLGSRTNNNIPWNNKVAGDEDHRGSTFFSYYPPNHFIGNVAAGSDSHGFFLHNWWWNRGEDGQNNGLTPPRRLKMGTFEENEAHSNSQAALAGYDFEQDLYGLGVPVIESFKSYRNQAQGFYMQASQGVTVVGGIIADNRVGIEIPFSDKVVLSGVDLRGLSDLTKEATKASGMWKLCPSSHPVVGVKIPTHLYRDWVTPEGSFIQNAKFTDFDNSDDCLGSTQISFDDRSRRDGHWNFLSSLENAAVVDSRGPMLDFCSASSRGVDDIILNDKDGSLDPSGIATVHSSIVSNEGHMTTFANCTSYPDHKCLAYCRDTCMRTVSFAVEYDGTENFTLQVTRDIDGKEILVNGKAEVSNGAGTFWNSWESRHRRFSATLPGGSYTVAFLDANGDMTWPVWAQEKWEGAPDCEGYPTAVDISVAKPDLGSGYCDNLVANGDMEGGPQHWRHNIYNGGVTTLSGAGVNGSDAVSTIGRYSPWHYLGHYLDTSCLHANVGKYYEIRAWLRLEKDGVSVACNPSSTNYNDDACPTVTFRFAGFNDVATKESVWSRWHGSKAIVGVPYNKDSFNLVQGIVQVSEGLELAQHLFAYFERTNKDYDIILDEVSFAPFDPGCEEFIMNGDFHAGDSAYWHRRGNAYFEMVEGSRGQGDFALKASARGHWSHSARQDLNLNCLNVGDRIAITVRHKLERDGSTYQCDPFSWDTSVRCSDVYLHSRKPGRHEYHRVAETVGTANAENDGWRTIAGIHTMGDGNQGADYWTIYFDGSSQESDLLIDDVSIQPIPQDCNNLVLNPSFDDGTTSFWLNDDRQWSKVGVVSPGAGGDGYALRSYDRNYPWRGIRQDLDIRCFNEDQEFEIRGKFRLVNSTGHGVMCNKDILYGNTENCPSVHLQAWNCDGQPNNFWLRFWNQVPFFQWSPDDFNDFSASFVVDANLAACNNIRVHVRDVNSEWDIIVDDFQITTPNAPSPSPTLSPTIATTLEVVTPTAAPTARTPAPTAIAQSCPFDDDTPEQIASGAAFISRSENLCILTKKSNGGTPVPVARSYSGNDWELSAGNATSLLSGESWSCYQHGCQIMLPPLNDGDAYYLTSYASNVRRRLSEQRTERDVIARLLESTTFGPTADELDGFVADYNMTNIDMAMAEYVADQMDEPTTSHREFFRRRTNPRFPTPRQIGKADHPCDTHSRWRTFAFTRKDSVWWRSDIFKVTGLGPGGTAPYSISLNGHIRTIVQSIEFLNSDYDIDQAFDYEMCWSPQEQLDGIFYVRVQDGSCQSLLNPAVNFTGYESTPNFVLDLTVFTEAIDEDRTNGEEWILMSALDDPLCGNIPEIVEDGDAPVFGLSSDGTWLLYDPRLRLQDNTPDAPIVDAGGSVVLKTGGETLCSNAARTFLNEDQCILSPSSSACGSVPAPEVQIELNEDNVVQLHSLTERYVYIMMGLTVVDEFNNKISHPCVYGQTSRWEVQALSECNPTTLDVDANHTLFSLLQKESDNPYILDITVPDEGTEGIVCGNYTDPNVEIVVGDTCFKHAHPDHMSIYDLTFWTKNDTHPGNMPALMAGEFNPIKKWLDQNSSAFITFPSKHPEGSGFDHPITRWESNKNRFTYVGRYGDSVRFRDLPNELRLDDVAQHYGATGGVNGDGVLVCGSHGEVSNDPSLGNFFDVATGLDTSWDLDEQREQVWTMIALSAPDQLRQRVAWSLAQLLVVVKSALQSQWRNTENLLNYYDIFVRHAFGNYRDILREISYNALMAENLSYLQSRSAAYMYENQNGKISFADENFSREIMQLFSIGLVQLNPDGTPRLDDSGNFIPTYTNEAIMSFARLWTGFDLHQKRGNIEEAEWSGNRLDPMRIEPTWRDRFPKSDLADGYIGDRYPLCVDLPNQMFLKRGARYRLLGSSSLPEVMGEDPSQFGTDPTIRRFVLDENSHLNNLLCNSDANGECQFVNLVELESNLNCTALECDVDTVRVLQVAPNIFYEYVRPPCVEQSFFSGAIKLSQRYRSSGKNTCANPRLPVAAEACCAQGDLRAIRNAIYDGERMTYDTAKDRCSDISRMVCDYNDVSLTENDEWYKTGYHWAKDQCLVRAKVRSDGYLAIVYEPEKYMDKVLHIDEHTSLNFFKAYWDGNSYPTEDNACADEACEMLPDKTCLCDTTLSEKRVYSSMPGSVEDIFAKLYIGAFDPTAYGTYTSEVDTYTGITAFTVGGNYDTSTIFQVVDDKTGQTFFLKNAIETVHVQGANGMAFRNAPHFMSLIHTETTVRDAQYETEAGLDHYFYHDNTAPFIAVRLIQRLTSSNPSPRYVEQVATAFRTGTFISGGQEFGSGEYGDLGSSIAAVLLDREARDVILDVDPSSGLLKEPILKVLSLMRSMEFVPVPNDPVIRLHHMEESLGQMAYEFPSVFSFFLPEHLPAGRLGDARLVGPEAALLDMPKTVSSLNGMFSMIKYGLSNCYQGFGLWADFHHSSCSDDGQYTRANGVLRYNPAAATNTSDVIVDDLATLLTAGRLSASSRQIVKNAFDAAADSDAGLRIAQQLIVTSPEFHCTNEVKKATNQTRPPPTLPQPSQQPYKAVVYIMFSGGCDSYNMLVPYGNCTDKDLFEEYSMVREQVALSKVQLQDTLISATDQVCETFGIHQNLPFLKDLYDDGDLLFLANTGVMTRPVNKENYWQYTETQLFAHNHMQRETMRIDPLEEAGNTGVLGRMSDVLTGTGHSVGSFSLDRLSVSLSGHPGQSPSAFIISQHGVNEFNPDPTKPDMMQDITALNEATTPDSGFFAETWSDSLLRSLAHNDLLHTTMESLETENEFPETDVGRKLRTVAKMIATRAERGAERDFFFVETHGYDTHADVAENLESRFTEVNDGTESFVSELKSMGVWDEVTTIQVSDFARTLAPNSGDGTDHAWGGNYYMFGGDVLGGQIAGTYPDDLTDDGPLGLGRGRLIPTTPWDGPFQAIAEWVGVDGNDLDAVCPNREQFPASSLFDASQLFKSSDVVRRRAETKGRRLRK